MRLHVKQLPTDQATFLQKRDEYFAAREAHKLTVGVPAPFPEFEILRVLYESGEALEIYDDPPAPAPTLNSASALVNRQRESALADLDAAIAALPAAQQGSLRLIQQLLKG